MWLRSHILPFWRRLRGDCPSVIARWVFFSRVKENAVVTTATTRWLVDEKSRPRALVHRRDVRFWLRKLTSQSATTGWLRGHLKVTSWSLQLDIGDWGTSYVNFSAALRSTALQSCTAQIWVTVVDRRRSYNTVGTQSFLSHQQGTLWTTLMATQIGVWALNFPFKLLWDSTELATCRHN